MIESRGNDPVIEDRVGEDIDKEDLLLSNRKTEEVNGNFIGRGVQDGGHDVMEGACFEEHLISFTSWSYLCWYQTASACPSNQGQCFVVSMRQGVFPAKRP